jgi:hypothetical protein
MKINSIFNKLQSSPMKTTLFFFFLLFLSGYNAQTFEDESSVISYMEGKSFYNSENGLQIEYGYISSYNTYGIKVINKNGAKFYFINVEITTYGSFADLYGMSPDDGSSFGFRLYTNKLIVGKGEPGEQTFFLK